MKNILLFSALGSAIVLAACTAQTSVEEAPVAMDHSQMMMHDTSMTMDDMVNMLKGKTGDDLDAAFLEGMIPHHQGAIDMANLVLENAKHEEIKQMAREIISAQQREIDMMKQWQKEWGYVE